MPERREVRRRLHEDIGDPRGFPEGRQHVQHGHAESRQRRREAIRGAIAFQDLAGSLDDVLQPTVVGIVDLEARRVQPGFSVRPAS